MAVSPGTMLINKTLQTKGAFVRNAPRSVNSVLATLKTVLVVSMGWWLMKESVYMNVRKGSMSQ